MKLLPWYAWEKYSAAVHALATGLGDARSRVRVAWSYIWPIGAEHFPEELRPRYEAMCKKLTRYGPETLDKIKNRTAADIAQMIYDLAFSLDNYIHDNSRSRGKN